MELILLIPFAIIALLIFISKIDNKKTYTRLLQIFYIINTFCLLSSCVVHYNESLPSGAGLDDGPLSWLFEVFMWPALINIGLRIIFFPYIYFALLTGIYIKDLKKNQFPKKETILFILLLLLSFLGLVFTEIEFQGLLRHIASF